MYRRLQALGWLMLTFLLTGCVTAIGGSLPRPQLPQVTLALQADLTASSSHPASKLPDSVIPAGTQLDVIGADSNAAWLLVIYQDKVGWIPSFYSQTGTSRIEPSIVVKPLDGACTQYMGATLAPEKAWVSSMSGSIIIEGTILLPAVQADFAQAALQVNITGDGEVVASDYLHLPLTPNSNIVFFAFAIEEVAQGSTIDFSLDDPSQEAVSFQATFFTDDCGEDRSMPGRANRAILDIGEIKSTLPNPSPTPSSTKLPVETPGMTSEASSTPGATSGGTPNDTPTMTPTATPTTIRITRGEQGPTRPEIQNLVAEWDRIHHEVDYSLDPSDLPTVLTGGALRQQEQTLRNLRAGSCYWEFTDLAPSQITEWREISANEVIVTMTKHWDGRLYCHGKPDQRSSFDEPFSVRYQIIRTNAGWRIAEKVPLENGVEITLPQASGSSQPTPTPATDNAADQLYTHLLAKSRNSRIAVANANAVEDFVATLVYRLDEFQLPREGITQQSMTNVLYQADSGDRLNGLIQEVWQDWLGLASSQKLDPYRANPQNRGLSTYRVLVVRMVQGTQGRFSTAEQRALHNYFSRYEDPGVWSSNVKGVIGAINRENFQ